MLRCKADLQEVVVSAEYEKQNWKASRSKDDNEDDDDEDLAGEGGVKKLLLDEEGFWKPLVSVLKVSSHPYACHVHA